MLAGQRRVDEGRYPEASSDIYHPEADMGTLKPWHLILTTLCCLGVAGVIAAVVMLVRRR